MLTKICFNTLINNTCKWELLIWYGDLGFTWCIGSLQYMNLVYKLMMKLKNKETLRNTKCSLKQCLTLIAHHKDEQNISLIAKYAFINLKDCIRVMDLLEKLSRGYPLRFHALVFVFPTKHSEVMHIIPVTTCNRYKLN